jgi:hypothetical protein
MRKVTGEEIKAAMIANDITVVPHHACSICDYMTQYVRVGEILYFDAGCDCVKTHGSLQESEWDDPAEWVNMQTVEETALRLAASFGLANLD